MGFNVLIVEDSIVMRSMIKRVFESCNLAKWSFIEASDGIEGLQKLQHNSVDLILLDVHMPRMDGLEFLEKLKSNLDYKKIPVLITTSEGNQIQLDQLKVHEVLIIQKPFTPETLQYNIEQVLQKIKVT